jgi:hypothetical protein
MLRRIDRSPHSRIHLEVFVLTQLVTNVQMKRFQSFPVFRVLMHITQMIRISCLAYLMHFRAIYRHIKAKSEESK